MPWFVYYRDLLRVVDLPSPVVTVDDAVKASLKLAEKLLGTVTRHCTYEGPSELIIEYWNNGESVKLINAENQPQPDTQAGVRPQRLISSE